MKLARYVSAAGERGVGRLVDARRARPLVGELFGRFTFADQPVEVQRFLPPVDPPNIFAIGRNYRAHVQETGARLPERPLVFIKPTTALIGDHDAIALPASAPQEVDFEAELAIIIGRTCRRVPEADALDHVLGYTCANDVSARDCQRNDKQWSRAKGFDTFCPLGPWLVTPDEIDPQDCPVRSRVNGELMQDGNTSAMIFPCPSLISYLSHQFTLLPGTVILTGTPDGVGFARQPPVFLRDGDQVEIEIEGIGKLTNPVRGPQTG
jgi:2-keto-4-pentenoate hydratase/2-oxohepta-3-ene-1,7-dioic acid hydratase in catechol pathway